MKEVADGVWRLSEFPPRPVINIYVAGDVIFDAGRIWDARRILKQTSDRELSLLALTHVHPDHQGAAHAVCEERGIPLACHEDDVDAMEGRRPVRASDAALAKFYARLWEGPSHKVDMPLREGDDVGDFTVIHAPGHAPGEVIFWRESDRVAICGDTLRNMSFATTRARLDMMPRDLTPDVEEAARSIRKLADLGPEVTLPGHGPPVRGAAPIAGLADRLGA
ncbi:MAG TPA: MBL fold metallo-hydrolase [Solirubrobacterales bacterium]